MKKESLPEWLRLVRGDMEDDKPCDLLLAEPIGFDPTTYSGMSSRRYAEVLNSFPKGKEVNVLINTLGGSVPEGTAMANMNMSRGKVNTTVIGYAASMGAIVALSGNKRTMMPGTAIVIHNPWGGTEGDYRDMQDAAVKYKQVKDTLVDFMSQRCSLSKQRLSDMMDATTYLSPDEAKEAGMCDEVIKGDEIYNSLEKHSPESVLKTFRTFGAITAPRAAVEIEQKQNENKTMKTLIAALAAKKLLPTADMTDEAAIVAAFNKAFEPFETAVTKNTELQSKVDTEAASRKTRVDKVVAKAVEDKLIKSDDATKKRYTDLGLRDEVELINSIEDLVALKGSTVVPPKRGTAPVPPEKQGGADTNESKIEELQGKLNDATPSEKVEISRQIRELRGHKDIFAPATKK